MKRTIHLIAYVAIVIFAGCGGSEKTGTNSTSKSKPFVFKVLPKKVAESKKLENTNIFPYYKSGSWGYMDNAGRMIIEPIFSNCGFFVDDYAWVKKDDKFGVIATDGKFIFNCDYDSAQTMRHSLIPLMKDNLWGLYKPTGELVLPHKLRDFRFYDDSKIMVQIEGMWGMMDIQGRTIIKPIYDREFSFVGNTAIVRIDGKEGLIDVNGNQLVECKDRILSRVNDSLFISRGYLNRVLCTYALIDSKGRTLLPEGIWTIESVNGNRLLIEGPSGFGLLNCNLDTVIGCHFERIRWGNTNLLAVKNKYNWGYLSTDGDTIINFQYVNAEAFVDSLALVDYLMDAQVINFTGSVIMKNLHGECLILNGNLIKTWDRETYNLYDGQGKKLNDLPYDTYQYHTRQDIDGYIYSNVSFTQFQNGRAIVGRNGFMGLIDENGKLVVPLKYHKVFPANEFGFSVVEFWGKTGVIDKWGKEIIPLKYYSLSFEKEANCYMAYAESTTKQKDDYYYQDDPIGYVDLDGTYYGDSVFGPSPFEMIQKQMEDIKKAYENVKIEEGAAGGNGFQDEIYKDSLEFHFQEGKILYVKDEGNHATYEYYYDSTLNIFGPYFIYTSKSYNGKKFEDRYYYMHGKIIKWIDRDGVDQPVVNAIYSPEHGAHNLARQHLAILKNLPEHSNTIRNNMVNEIDAYCKQITFNVENGSFTITKNEGGEGEWTSEETLYTDEHDVAYYTLLTESNENGTFNYDYFYKDGQTVYSKSDAVFEEYSDQAGWVGGFKIRRTYYFSDGTRTYIEKDNVVEIVDDFSKQ